MITVALTPKLEDFVSTIERWLEEDLKVPRSQLSLKLEIDAEVPSGLDRAKVRTLLENATTLSFIDKAIK